MFVFLLATYIKKERKSLIISDMLVFFLYPVALFTCFLPRFKRKGNKRMKRNCFMASGRLPDFSYYAFISYSHKDMKWGRWLQRRLETFHIPRDIVKAQRQHKQLRIFRDQTDLADIYKLLRVPYRTADPDSRWVSYQPATDSTQATYIPYAPVEGKVPNCYGMTAKDAVELLQSMGYRARVRGYGRVFNQSVKGQAAQGTTVVLTMK